MHVIVLSFLTIRHEKSVNCTGLILYIFHAIVQLVFTWAFVEGYKLFLFRILVHVTVCFTNSIDTDGNVHNVVLYQSLYCLL